jgi:hypothetical protein
MHIPPNLKLKMIRKSEKTDIIILFLFNREEFRKRLKCMETEGFKNLPPPKKK